MLDVRRLRLLHELRRRGTIAAVAEALHFSPSAVSQQLAALELEAGVPLLERVGRGVRLTDAGHQLAASADAVLTLLEHAQTDLAALANVPAGTIRIASFQTVTLAFMPNALDALGKHERLRVELAQVEPEHAIPALLGHEFDLVVGEEYPGVPAAISVDMHREDLCRDALRLAVPTRHPAAPVHLEDAAGYPWVMEPTGTASRIWATTMCRSAGFEPDVRYESDDLLAHVALVAHGHAAAFLPDLVWRDRPPDIPVHPLAGQERVIFTLVRNGTAHHPAIRAVRDTLRALVSPTRGAAVG